MSTDCSCNESFTCDFHQSEIEAALRREQDLAREEKVEDRLTAIENDIISIKRQLSDILDEVRSLGGDNCCCR